MTTENSYPYSGINIEDIKNKCIDFLNQLQPETKPKNFLIEEMEISNDGQFWLVTIGYDQLIQYSNPTQLTRILTNLETYERVYKIFKVEGQTGKVMSMKMRENVD